MRHRKFARLARLIGSEVLARGHLELLWEVAYENGDDLVGDAGDLEHLAKWTGEAGILASALVESGFIDLDGDRYRVHDLWDHAPDYVRKRRQRETERQTKGAGLQSLTGQSPPNVGQSPPNGRTRAPAPAPAPSQDDDTPPSPPRNAIPSKAERMAELYPATQAVLDALAATGVPVDHAAEATTRAKVEQLVTRLPVAVAVAAIRAGHARKGKLFAGWYTDELAAAVRDLDAPPAPQLFVLDLSWIDQLPEPRRAAARAAWSAKQAEVEITFDASAVPRILASSAEALRLDLTRQPKEAAL
jgi:hypothetical protein